MGLEKLREANRDKSLQLFQIQGLSKKVKMNIESLRRAYKEGAGGFCLQETDVCRGRLINQPVISCGRGRPATTTARAPRKTNLEPEHFDDSRLAVRTGIRMFFYGVLENWPCRMSKKVSSPLSPLGWCRLFYRTVEDHIPWSPRSRISRNSLPSSSPRFHLRGALNLTNPRAIGQRS